MGALQLIYQIFYMLKISTQILSKEGSSHERPVRPNFSTM